jgi:hypothetical protein
MIEITAHCQHRRDYIKGITMLVIARKLRPPLAIACPECRRILFMVRERQDRDAEEAAR